MVRNIQFLLIGSALLLLFVGACTTAKTSEIDQTMMHDDQEMEGMMHGPALIAHVGAYVVTFERVSFSSGDESSLAFTLADVEEDAVTDLDIMHEQPMHLILVRDDLEYFDHLHPDLDGTSWMTPVTFLAPGKYHLWIDFTKDMQQHLVDFYFTVEGSESQPEPDRLGELTVTPTIPEQIVVGESTLRFTVTNKGVEVPITETFLGVAAHLIVIDDTLTEFIHDHDMVMDNDAVLSFNPTFLQSGLHRAWVQFSVDGQDRVAPFTFSVSKK